MRLAGLDLMKNLKKFREDYSITEKRSSEECELQLGNNEQIAYQMLNNINVGKIPAAAPLMDQMEMKCTESYLVSSHKTYEHFACN